MKPGMVTCLCAFSAVLLLPASGHGDPHDGLARLSLEIRATPTAALHYRRGCLRLENGDAIAALADFQQVDRMAPGSGETAPLRADAFTRLGKHRKALRILDAFLAEHPDASRVLVRRARTWIQLGDPAAAIRDYQKALALTPDAEPDLILEIARVFEREHRFLEASEVLDQGMAQLGPIASLRTPALKLGWKPSPKPSRSVSRIQAAPVQRKGTVGNIPPVVSVTRGPYLQLATPDSMIVRWRTDQAVTGRVNIGPSPGSISQSFDESTTSTEHAVKLTGLTPDTVGFYSVGSGGTIHAGGDADHTFTTPPVAGTAKNTRVWVLGDAGTNSIVQRNVRDAFYNFTGTRTPDLCLLLGDNAYGSGLDAEYQAALFDTYPTLLRKTPFWSCLGNHDTAQSVSFTDAYPYFDVFSFPTQGEAGGAASGTEHYYSFNHANIHFISLDSMTADRAPDGAMATWLVNDLASVTTTWTIVFFHHPPYTKGSHDSDLENELIEMRENILPILENGGVDLVLSGHSHSYERSFLLDGHYGFSGTLTATMKRNPGDGMPAGDGAYVKPLSGPKDHFGAVYNVAGSAGHASSGTVNHPAMCFSVLEAGSVVLDINGNRLDSTFIREDGVIRDTYTILKQGEADSDADDIPDSYELANGLDRHDRGDRDTDADGDGADNLTEYAFGRPASVADVYQFTTTPGPGTMTIQFPTVTGRNYRVLWSHDLLEGGWHAGSPSIPGTGNMESWTDDGPITPGPPGTGAPRRFYRIEASPAQ